MSRSFVATSSQYLEVNSTPVTVTPLTLACWYNESGAAGLATLMAVVSSSTNDNWFRLRANGNINALVRRTSNTETAGANTTTSYSANTWMHACGVFASAVSRAAYLNGGGKGTNTSNFAPVSPNRISIGRLGRLAPIEYANGLIAHPAIWNVALSDDEVAMLALGRVSPLMVRPQNLVFYVPYTGRDSPERDIIGGLSLTVTGATVSSEEPPMMWIRRRTRIFIPAALVLADIAAGGAIGATFDARAVTAGVLSNDVSAGAQLSAQAVARALFTDGVGASDQDTGAAHAIDSLAAGVSAGMVATATAEALAALTAGLIAGELWASQVQSAAELAASGEFGASFEYIVQAAQSNLDAGTEASAFFSAAAAALASLTAGASLAAAIAAIAVTAGQLSAGITAGASFAALTNSRDTLLAAFSGADVWALSNAALASLAAVVGANDLYNAAAVTHAEIEAGALFSDSFIAERGIMAIVLPSCNIIEVERAADPIVVKPNPSRIIVPRCR